MGRTEISTDDFRATLKDEIHQFATAKVDEELVRWLVERVYYTPGEFQDAAAFARLEQTIEKAEAERATGGSRLYYLAVPPAFFSTIVDQLGKAGMVREENGHFRRVIIEKPFGRDLESAQELNRNIRKILSEGQIYRIDHYLGKETVQNIMAFRFANGIFEPIWNRRYIDHIQISVTETVGVEQRGGYYDHAGALRDMVPNHIMQLISLTAMEPPISFQADAVRDEQAKILHAIQPLTSEEVLTRTVRGQYGEGVIDGERVRAYR